MASTTYNGVESAQGGNLFQGIKFWVARRVPMRNDLLGMIESNGGVVVPLEKQANYLIADHARKDVPPGSHSFNFITHSVKHGALQVPDKYFIGLDPDSQRPVAQDGRPTKTRMPFTPAEDASLMRLVLSHPTGRRGNKIFQKYAETHPRHTWQSWRERYNKKLSKLTTAQQQSMAASAPGEAEVATGTQHDTAIPSEPSPWAVTATQSQAQPRTLPSPVPESTAPPRVQERASTPEISAKTRELDQQVETEAEEEQHDPDHLPNDVVDTPESQDAEKRKNFYEDFQVYVDAAGVKDVELQPTFGGRKIELWDLLSCTEREDFDPDDIDWTMVTDVLGLESTNNAQVLKSLQQYFNVILQFIEAMEDFTQDDGPRLEEEKEDEEEEEEGGGEGVDSNEDFEQEEEEGIDPSETFEEEQELGEPVETRRILRSPPDDFPSSLPISITNRKRPLDEQGQLPSKPVKRMRLSRDTEIPSTPDSKAGIKRQTVSPSRRKDVLPHYNIADSEASQQLPTLPGTSKQRHVGSASLEPGLVSSQPSQLRTRQSPSDATPFQRSGSETSDSTSSDPLTRRHQSSDRERTPRAQSVSAGEPSVRNRRATSEARVELGPSSMREKDKKRRVLPATFQSSSQAPLKPIAGATPNRSGPAEENQRQRKSSTEDPNKKAIDECVRYYEVKYSRDIVIKGLQCTTMTPGALAVQVMDSLAKGAGVPSHHEGIWTDRDDDDLRLISSVDPDMQPTNQREIWRMNKAKDASTRLINKHGPEMIELRRAFLDAMRG